MLNYNHYLKELGIEETDYPFKKEDDRYYPDEEGFVSAEFFDLDITFAYYIYSHLCYFRDNCLIGCPARLTMEEWVKIINQMIEGFKLFIQKEDYIQNMVSLNDNERVRYFKRRQRKINRGLRLFAQYFGDLWY